MVQSELIIINKLGLHARACAKLTEIAGRFSSQIWVEKNGRRVNAKSIMGLMMLAAAKGSRILVSAEGDDAEAAVAAITELVTNRFGEPE